MLDDRIALMVADKAARQYCFFPFTLGGICSQISSLEADVLKTVKYNIVDDIELRVANEADGALLYDLLRSYGMSPCNYENLEIFAEEKLDLIVRNMTHCLDHRFFITFLLFCRKQPVAFFQVDPYNLKTIESIYQNKLLLRWNLFLEDPIDLHDLMQKSEQVRYDWLGKHMKVDVFRQVCKERNLMWTEEDWCSFVAYCIQSYQLFRGTLKGSAWLGNISYNIIPNFQRKGLMTKMISSLEDVLGKCTDCHSLFSDRISDKNIRSIALLKRLAFKQGGNFSCHYGKDYRTRAHPNGNFSESCVCFYKKIA